METFEEYSNRLQTYTIRNWPLRHYKLTPTKVSRWGFKSINSNSLQCSMCQHIVNLNCFPEEVEDLTLKEILYQKFMAILPLSHEDNCIFKNALKDQPSIFKINREFLFLNAQKFYIDNYVTLKDQQQIPLINSRVFDTIPEHLRIVFYNSITDYESRKVNASKCFAIFGWRLTINLNALIDNNNNLNCVFCGRTLKFSQFHISSNLQITDETALEGSFNLIEEHRYFCKWANIDVSNHKIYGYSILIQQLYDHYLKENPNKTVQPKQDSMVQITVLRRELVTQLHRLKKEQQSLAQQLESIEKENEAISERLVKRKRHELEQEQIDQEFQDELRKKIKMKQDEREREYQEKLAEKHKEQQLLDQSKQQIDETNQREQQDLEINQDQIEYNDQYSIEENNEYIQQIQEQENANNQKNFEFNLYLEDNNLQQPQINNNEQNDEIQNINQNNQDPIILIPQDRFQNEATNFINTHPNNQGSLSTVINNETVEMNENNQTSVNPVQQDTRIFENIQNNSPQHIIVEQTNAQQNLETNQEMEIEYQGTLTENNIQQQIEVAYEINQPKPPALFQEDVIVIDENKLFQNQNETQQPEVQIQYEEEIQDSQDLINNEIQLEAPIEEEEMQNNIEEKQQSNEEEISQEKVEFKDIIENLQEPEQDIKIVDEID